MLSTPTSADRSRSIPEGVVTISAPHPREISGVAAIPGGYAVVGDETPDHGCIWPGGLDFPLPAGLHGPESIDVAVNPEGEEVWLILCEKRSRLVDLTGGGADFGEDLAELHGRGLEGIALRWHAGAWQVALAWEDGFFDFNSDRSGEHAAPRIVTLEWRPGAGAADGSMTSVELDLPEPSEAQRFRVADLAWDGDDLLLLLRSTDRTRKKRKHTWLQRFDLAGRPTAPPLRLEECWSDFATKRNWEALDWTLDGRWLVLGHDAKRKRERQILAIFRYR